MQASQLRLEVPCFAMRPAGAPATANDSELSVATASDGDRTELSPVLVAQAGPSTTVRVSVPGTSNPVEGRDVEVAGDLLNASLSAELAPVLARAVALVDMRPNADGSVTGGSGFPNDWSTRADSSFPSPRNSSTTAFPRSSASKMVSELPRGGIRGRRPATFRCGRQRLPFSAPQPLTSSHAGAASHMLRLSD